MDIVKVVGACASEEATKKKTKKKNDEDMEEEELRRENLHKEIGERDANFTRPRLEGKTIPHTHTAQNKHTQQSISCSAGWRGVRVSEGGEGK